MGRRLLLTVALVAALAPVAHAAPGQESILQDDNLLLYRGDDVAARTLTEAAALGVDRVRLSVHWRSLAPKERASLRDATDPAAYEAAVFDKFDHVVRVGRRLGVGVLLNPTGPGPAWAAGGPKGLVKPNARAFGQFVQMLGRRYDGTYRDENEGQAVLPRVTVWSVWNEPNHGAFLQPQWVRSPRGRWIATSPRLYRSLARQAIDGLRRSGHADSTILIGETAPTGTSRRGATRVMRPGRFLRELFCLDGRLRPVRGGSCDYVAKGGLAANGFGHHPYSVTSPPASRRANPDEIALGDRRRLFRILDAALAARRVPAGLPVWFTEYGYQTRPPDPYRGIAPDTAARWLAVAEALTRADPRVAAHAQFLLRDDDPWTQFPATDRRRWTTYQTGLRYDDGRAKPSLDAYRLPLTAPGRVPAGGRLRLWGHVRPAAGTEPTQVQLEFAPAGSDDWAPVGGALTTDGHQSFSVDVVPPGTGAWRFVWTPPPPAAPPPSVLDPIGGGGGPPAPPAPVRSAPVGVRVG